MILVGESAGVVGPSGMQLDLERGDVESVWEMGREITTPMPGRAVAEAQNASSSSSGRVVTMEEGGTVRRMKVATRNSVLRL